MAYRSNLIEEEDQKALNQETPSSGVIQTKSATAPAMSAPSPTAAPAQGSGFVNLEKYLQANQGSQAGLAKTVGSAMQDEKYKSGIQEAQKAYGIQAQKESERLQQQGQEAVSALEKSPTEGVEQARTLVTESYAGPTADIYQAQIKAAQKAQEENIKRLGTAEAQQEILQKQFGGKPQYTKGYSLLDQYLLQRNPEAQALLSEQRTKAEAETKRAGEEAAGNLLKQQSDVLKAKEKQKADILAAAKGQKEQRLGKAGADIERLNRAIVKRQGAQEASFGDVLSAEQAADIEALASLSGEDVGNLRRKTFKEGTAPIPQGGFEMTPPGQVPTQSPQVKEKANILQKLEKDIRSKAKLPKIKI